MTIQLPFRDRREAGRLLAEAVADLDPENPLVLALPRGGVPVAFEVATRLKAPLDILLVRKIGAPGHAEFGIGAVVDGPQPQRVIDEACARTVGADDAYIERETDRQLREIERRRAVYRSGNAISVTGRTVVVVDDGIATGGTVSAALTALARSGPRQIILAVPVAPRDTLARLQRHCDALVCLASPEPFLAVGRFYQDFTQTEDEEVIRLLGEARRMHCT